MADREKVIKGLQIHADGCGYRSHHCDAMDCPYRYGDESCDVEEMCRDAYELLKEQKAHKFFVDESGKITPLPVVVRCKDCVKRGFDDCPVNGWMPNKTEGDWFCADGERREG